MIKAAERLPNLILQFGDTIITYTMHDTTTTSQIVINSENWDITINPSKGKENYPPTWILVPIRFFDPCTGILPFKMALTKLIIVDVLPTRVIIDNTKERRPKLREGIERWSKYIWIWLWILTYHLINTWWLHDDFKKFKKLKINEGKWGKEI